jgi:CRP-like cAMP-binding protein
MAASSQNPSPSLASDLPSAKASDSSIDQALTLLLADETEAALRWGAAALQRDPSTSSALVVTSRLLQRMGRTRAAIEGLETAVRRAIDAGNLPLAIAAIDELRALGENVGDLFDHVSQTFCNDSARLDEGTAPLSPHFDDFQPLSSFLAGPALASKATQIVWAATRSEGETASDKLPPVARLPLFSALPKDALRDLLAAFDVITVPAGYCVMEEGDMGAAAYIVARGEVLLRRASGTKPPVVLARLGSGAFFGEMALLSEMPRSASAVATRPSILLVATREALDAVARRHPVVAVELAAHCHRRLVANLGRIAPILAALPPAERAVIVEKFVTRIFSKGERLATKGEEIGGLHLLASGAVAIVAHDGSERVVLATLTAGETIGEVELVLCRRANADAIALQPTVTLFLSREDFAALLLDHPALVHGLYVSAVRRDGETAQALESSAFTTNDYQLDDLAPEPVANEPPVAEETRLYGEVYADPAPAPTPAAVALEPETHVTARLPASLSETLPAVPSPAPEPVKAASVTAPFPPVIRAPAPVDENPAKVVAASVSVPPALPPMPATARPSTIATPDLGPPPPVVPSASAAIGEPQKPGTLPRFSSMSALVASKPPKPSGASSSRGNRFGELPPVAVLGMFVGVAVLGFALAAPFSNHLNTAAASGGGGQNAAPTSEVPAAGDPSVAPLPDSPPAASAPAAPLPAPPAQTVVPPAHTLSTDATHTHPTTPPAPAPSSSSVATTGARPARRIGPKTAAAAPPVPDEFGGRE